MTGTMLEFGIWACVSLATAPIMPVVPFFSREARATIMWRVGVQVVGAGVSDWAEVSGKVASVAARVSRGSMMNEFLDADGL